MRLNTTPMGNMGGVVRYKVACIVTNRDGSSHTGREESGRPTYVHKWGYLPAVYTHARMDHICISTQPTAGKEYYKSDTDY